MLFFRCLRRLSGVRDRLSALHAFKGRHNGSIAFANGKLKKSNREMRTRVSFRERRRETTKLENSKSSRCKRGDFCRVCAQKTRTHSRHHRHHSKATMMIKSRRWGKTKKTYHFRVLPRRSILLDERNRVFRRDWYGT